MTADPELPVPPKHYGGIERIIDLLAQELVRRGHEVTLFAHPASASAGRFIPYPGKSSASALDTVRNAATIARFVLDGGADVVHSFSRLAYLLPILPLRIPKLMTYQRAITPRSIRLGDLMSRGSLQFAAISNHMMKPVANIGRWHVVPNCASLKDYEFQPKIGSDAPLMFLGRIEEIKGPHVAIDVARRSGLKLCIAGNVPAGEERFFESRIRPFIDGDAVVYVGPVDDAEKNRLLGRARALLMPVLWEEPFGIVMVEAMACGTPVLGLNRGAVPEVVEEGVSGFVRSDIDGLVEAVARLGEIDRRHCRDRVERQFSETILAERYLSAYRDVIASCGRRADG
ncbi:MAG: glycosyltransferase family 4 protein [Xanthobacteraceae bacterium]